MPIYFIMLHFDFSRYKISHHINLYFLVINFDYNLAFYTWINK